MSQEPFVIHGDVRIQGGVITDRDVVVLGHIEGRVTCPRVKILRGALITGDIVAEFADVAGTVDGNVFAHVLFLRSSCEVFGDIFHGELQLDAGCYFEGKSRHVEHPRTFAG